MYLGPYTKADHFFFYSSFSDNFTTIGSEFLDLFLMGILAVFCHWITGEVMMIPALQISMFNGH